MTKFLTQQYTAAKSDRLNSKTKEHLRVDRFSLNVLLLGLILFVGVSYLYFVNQTATGGFDIKRLENKIEQLTKTNKDLEIKTAELQSLSVIEDATVDFNLVAIDQVEYLGSTDAAVAVR